ncbi:MAG: hypothetical protein ACRDKE_00200 [Solirubrobacterales bacterium]
MTICNLRRMTRKLCISLSLVVVLLVALPTSGSAATTIGSSMTGTPTVKPGQCNVITPNVPVSCTLFVGSYANPADEAPGGRFAPAPGVITRWRVAVGAGQTTSLTLTPRVIGVTTLYTALRSGTPQSIPTAGGSFTFEAHLPVAKNDFFAIDAISDGLAGAGPAVVATTADNASFVAKTPAVPDGATFSVLGTIGPPTQTKLLINADIEPDADGDTYGDETQDLCTTRADVHTVCPPPLVSQPTLTKGAFSFTSDIAAKATTTLFKVSNGRKVGKKCKAKSKRGKKCKIYTKFAQWNDDVVAGANNTSYAYKVGGKSLKPGKYRATIVITSPQNTVTTKTIDFSIKKSKKK